MGKILALTCIFVSVVAASASATVFFTDGFDYADGDLTSTSGGLWANHSGSGGDIQVVSGEAIVVAPGSDDDNRLTGVFAGPADEWFYATNFNVTNPNATLAEDYFIHFKDGETGAATTFNARLSITDPTAGGDFGLEIAASSLGDGTSPWPSDFTFGQQITAVVGWNNGTGVATLWIDPTDSSSPNVTDDELVDAGELLEAVALRQDSSTGNTVAVDIISAGTTFDEVLAAIGGATVPGDYDNDDDVDGEDFLVWQRGGSPNPMSPADLNLWETNFGTTSSTLYISAVPEPTSMGLLALGLGLTGTVLRHRNRS